MINTTDKPVVLMQGFDLDTAVRESLTWANCSLQATFDCLNVKPYLRYAFNDFFGAGNRKERLLDEAFVQAVYEWQETDSRGLGSKNIMSRIVTYVARRSVSASAFPNVKRGLRLALIELWRRGAVLLPSTFTPGPYFDVKSCEHEVLNWLLSFLTDNRQGGDMKTDARRIRYYGPRLIWTTNWQNIEDINLDDIAELNLAQLRHVKGIHPFRISGSPFPFSQLPAYCLRAYPERCSFTRSDLERYSAWSARQGSNRGVFEEFSTEFKIATRRVANAKRTRRKQPTLNPNPDVDVDVSVEVSVAATHAAVLQVFAAASRRRDVGSWAPDCEPGYAGREHVDLGAISPLWVRCLSAYLHHRKRVQGMRGTEVLSSLRILADYLFLYLPWWKELYPTSLLALPSAPKDFTRFAFATRSTDEALEILPKPLLEMIRIRRPGPDGAGAAIRHLAMFFRFVGTHFADDARITGDSYKNPLDEEFDLPRGKGRKNKTTKVVIPRHIYGHLLAYCYTIEQFGEHLLKLSLAGQLDKREQGRASFDCHRLGFVPSVRYRGRHYPVELVPNVFAWSEREIARDGSRIKCLVPHLTALRLLTAAVETGLRLQSLQWLDRTTFDCLNTRETEHQYVYRLLVNTDKTKAEAWVTLVVFRVRNLLKRELEFQRLFADFDFHSPVLYEGSDASPFDPIAPLFRAPSSGQPVRDDVYYDAWTPLLVEFERFFRGATGEKHTELYYFKRIEQADGSPVIHYTNGNHSVAYCPLSLRTYITPHSCRATFATNRQLKGGLELQDLCELLGHEDIVTTNHYIKPSSAQLSERLEACDGELLGDYELFESGKASAFVRADTPDSQLRKSFERDREKTIKTFGFTGPVSLWSIGDRTLEEHDGMEMLRNGPMARIRFRETHVCPVGEECPYDILQHIGEPRRCGMCPLAMKCVEHLPAISAKCHMLHERIKYVHVQLRRFEAASEPQTTVDALWDELQLDTNEYLGWKASESALQHLLANAVTDAEEGAALFVVEQPEVVRRHLKLVTRQRDKAGFLLQRIAESNAYPSLTSPQVQVAASLVRRRLLSNQRLEDFSTLCDDGDDVRAAATLLGTVMKASGMGFQEVEKLLSEPKAEEQSDKEFLQVR